MKETAGCNCGVGLRMVFACSGAADVGAITDLAARRLQKDRQAAMCCTAAIAANVTAIVEKARQAGMVLAIDGCSERCADRILEDAGFENRRSLMLEDLGMEKGSSQPTESAVCQVVDQALAVMSGATGERTDG